MDKWLPITGFSNYAVSNDGRVKNTVTDRELKPIRERTGYSHVTLCNGGKHHQTSIHRLVAQEFIPNPDDKPMVNHIDGDKANNRVDNLEWCTPSENMQHAYRTGLQKPIASQIQQSLAKSAEVRRKPVRNMDTGVEYSSVAECAKAENLQHSAVSFHLTGRAKRPRFEYIDKGGLNTNE